MGTTDDRRRSVDSCQPITSREVLYGVHALLQMRPDIPVGGGTLGAVGASADSSKGC